MHATLPLLETTDFPAIRRQRLSAGGWCSTSAAVRVRSVTSLPNWWVNKVA